MKKTTDVYEFKKPELDRFDKRYKYSGSLEGLWIYGEDTDKWFGIRPIVLDEGNGPVLKYWLFTKITSFMIVDSETKFTPKTNKEFFDFIENQFKK